MQKYDYFYKIVMMGDSNVGKTSIIRSQCGEKFSQYQPPFGVDFKINNIVLDGKIIKMQIWDTRNKNCCSLHRPHYKNADVVFIVFDLSNIESYKNLKKYIKECDDECQLTVKKFLIGNKSDIKEQKVTQKEIDKFSKKNKMIYFSTSAKTGSGINELFLHAIKNTIETVKYTNNQINQTNNEKNYLNMCNIL